MALPEQLGDREYQKFEEDADGNVAVRIGPNAIRDSAGNELDLNSFGMAQVYDKQVMTQLKEMTDILKDIRFQLQLITGAEIHE
jgi:hypothetical protein